MGQIYLNGLGVEKDYATALNWLRKAAGQNSSQAQNLLGFMFDNGLGVTADLAEAAGRMSIPTAPAGHDRGPIIAWGADAEGLGDAYAAREPSVPRLVVVSNRVPDAEGSRQAGGLAVAVDAGLRRYDGIWFGWSGKVAEDATAAAPRAVKRRSRTVITLDLSPVDFQEYYNGFANRVLWPILHYRVDLAGFTAVELGGYLRVNALFADALTRFIQPDDMVWVHDYHLLALAKELRARGHAIALRQGGSQTYGRPFQA